MTNDYQEQIQKLWPGWTIDGHLGAGSYGKVYRIRRVAHGRTDYSALKHIQIPFDQKQLNLLRSEGMTNENIRSHVAAIAEKCLNEINIMSQLKGSSNIVYIEDSQVLVREDRLHWDIFVKMELMSGLFDRMAEGYFAEKQVFKVAMDLTNALIQCEKLGMIHRDIKPENVLVSVGGDYKLGDFGAARQMSDTTFHMTQIGTINYMAPELYRGDGYDHRVDIYSLGILLYTLANRNRMPFVNPYSQNLTIQEREEATRYRLKGGKLTPPACVGNEFGKIILRACEYKPEDRYSSAMEMRQELFRIMPLIMTAQNETGNNKSDNPASIMNGNKYNTGFPGAVYSNNTPSKGNASNGTASNNFAYNAGNRSQTYNPSGQISAGDSNAPKQNQARSYSSSGKNDKVRKDLQHRTFRPDFLKIALALMSIVLIALIAYTVIFYSGRKPGKTDSKTLATAQVTPSSSISTSKEDDDRSDNKEESSAQSVSNSSASKNTVSLNSITSTPAPETSQDDETSEDTGDVYVLEPDSNHKENYNLSSVRISTPEGYELSRFTDGATNTPAYYALLVESHNDNVFSSGDFHLYSNDEYCASELPHTDDYYDDFKEIYTNVETKYGQHFETNAGTVYYVYVMYTTSSSDCTGSRCWMEYDDTTTVNFEVWWSGKRFDPTDELKKIFSCVQPK